MRRAGLRAGGQACTRQPMSLSISVPARSDNLRGILAMLAAMGSLIVNDVFIKVAAAELPTGETIFLRGLFTTLLGVGVDRRDHRASAPCARRRARHAGARRRRSRGHHPLLERADAHADRRRHGAPAVHAARHHRRGGVVPRRAAWAGGAGSPPWPGSSACSSSSGPAARGSIRTPLLPLPPSCSWPRATSSRAASAPEVPTIVVATVSAAAVTAASLAAGAVRDLERPSAPTVLMLFCRVSDCSAATTGSSSPCATATSPLSRRSATL